LKTVNQTCGPSSVDDQASETCADPTSVTETTGLVGGVTSGGSVKVTELLYPEKLPAASRAEMRRVKVRPASRPDRYTRLDAGPGNVSLLVPAQQLVYVTLYELSVEGFQANATL